MTSQDAIDYLTALWNSDHLSVDEAVALGMAIKALEQTRWIPVSERLPKIGERVMVTFQHEFEEGTVEITTYSKRGFYIQPVVAWKPLPEPYKAESEDKS